MNHIFLLLSIKIKMLLNGITKGDKKKRYRKMLALAGGCFFFYFIFNWMLDIFNTMIHTSQLEIAFVENFLTVMFLGFFIFLFFSGITISIHYLFVSSDLQFLITSPIQSQTIFSFKLIEAVFANSAFFFFLGIPTFIAYGWTLGASWIYYPLMLVNVFCFLTIPISISFIGALLIVRVLPARKAKEIMSIFLGIISVGIWILLQLIRSSAFNKNSQDFNPEALDKLKHVSNTTIFDALPSTWAAKGLTAIAQLDIQAIITNFLPLILLVILIFYIGIRLSKKTFDEGVIGSDQPVFRKNMVKKKKSPEQKSESSNYGRVSITRAIFLRDFRLYTRDSRHLMNIFMFIVMMIVLPLIQKGDQFDSDMAYYYPYIFIILFCAIISAQLSSRLIPVEAKCFWITKLLPQKEHKIVWGKFLLGFFFGVVISWIAVTIVGLYFHHPLRIMILAYFATLILSSSMASIGLFIGVIFTNFDWDHPKRMLKTTGGLLLSISAFITIAVIGGIIAGFYFIGIQFGFQQLYLDIQSIILGLILTGVIILIINLLSAKRLASMQWNY